MQEYHLLRILCLLLLSVYATAGIIKPSLAIAKANSQNTPASQSSPPIVDNYPSSWPNAQINHHSNPGTDSVQDTPAAAASMEDTGKVGIDSDRKRKQNPNPEAEEDEYVHLFDRLLNQVQHCFEGSIG
jgi:hypothetical protein